MNQNERVLAADGAASALRLTVDALAAELRQASERLRQETELRKHSEQALRQSAQRLRLHVEQTPLAVIEWDHDFRICAWNPAAERMFGYSREEAMGRHYAFIVPDSDRDAVDAVGEALMKQRAGRRCANRNTTRDGRTITCEWFSTPLVDAAGQTVGVASLVMDVTDRKQAEAALRESEQWHRAILQTAMDGIWRVDMQGRLLEVNEAYCRMSGYSEQELLGMHVRDLEAAERADDTASHIQRVIAQGTDRFETRHRRKDGSIYDVEVAVQHRHFEGECLVAFLHDITARKRAQQALRESEELLSTFLRYSPIQAYIKVATPTQSRFLMASDSYKEAHGMSDSDVVGKTMEQVFPPKFAATIAAEDWSVVSTGQVLKADVDEGGRNYTTIKFPIAQGGRAMLAGYTIDITERKRAEAQLARSHEQLANLARMLPGVIYQFRLYPDGRCAFPYCSPKMSNNCEVTPEEVREDATAFFERVHPGDRDRIRAAILESARALQTFQCEFRVILPRQGLRWRWTEAYPERTEDGGTLWHGTMQGITQRKKVQEALRESETAMAEAQQIAQLGSWEYDIAANRPKWSRQMFDLFGRDPGLGEPSWQEHQASIHPDDWKALDTCVRATMTSGVPYGVEFRLLHPTKGTRWCWTIGQPVLDSRGQPVKLRGTLQDITQRKQADDALRAAKEAAESATQVKDQFLAKLSHELRTPLTPVLLAVSQWQAQPGLPAALREDLAMVCRNLEMEARLLEDLLDVNRILYGKLSFRREVLSVHKVISEALVIVASAVQDKGINVNMVLQAADDRVDGDAARVQQIIWNLLSNAIKFTPDSGNITISTANEPDGQIRVRVTDSGLGIDANLLARLFKPFEQGDQRINRQYGGMGLGLSICNSLAEAHGGSITAASGGIGKGSTFTVHLPLARNPAQVKPAEELPPAQAAPASGPLRILLVEDNADTARIMSRLLCAKGHVVQTAGDVTSALQCTAHADFDVLVSDLGLPDGSGHDVMRQLVASGRKIKGIAVSGYGTEEDLRRSREAGFAEHLVKPINFPALLAAIGRVAGRHSAAKPHASEGASR